MTGKRVGIDLGTTYSLVAAMVDDKPSVLPNATGDTLTPSAVHVTQDGTVLVGAPARAMAAVEPERTALSFKRDMGTDREYSLGGRRFTPEELSALVLGAVKADAEAALGTEIEEAVVTVPAYFGELQRRATQVACELAGLHVERMINEPTAAALAYGLDQRGRELNAVVLDLGGGTFDVTVLEIMEGVIEIQSTAGDTRLGGEDFLDLIVSHVARRLHSLHGARLPKTGVPRARVRDACELAKRRLSSEQTTRLALPELKLEWKTVDVELMLSREEVDALYQPLFDRMTACVYRALRDVQRAAKDVEEVLLVGGATRMPSVVRLASQLFERLPARQLPPDEAVALGAAVQVALKAGDSAVADIVATDVAPFSLGIASAVTVGSTHVPGMFSPILERGTVLPASRVQSFATMVDGQTKIEIEVYQGEHSLCSDNQLIGQYLLKGIPRNDAGEEIVEVRFTYDMNGVLDIDATIVSTDETATFTIERSGGGLSKREIAKTRERLAALKFHPRSALPNVTALARADALHVELVGAERVRLGAAIAALRAALETQEPGATDEAREALIGVTSEMARGR
jgi:molecular chaperone HscC